MLQDPQVLGNDHNKLHSLMSDPISTMYFHNMFCDLLNKILFKPKVDRKVFYMMRIWLFLFINNNITEVTILSASCIISKVVRKFECDCIGKSCAHYLIY